MNLHSSLRSILSLLLLVPTATWSGSLPTRPLNEMFKRAFSIVTFHPSLWSGLWEFNFNRIAADECGADPLVLRNGVRVVLDEQGKIIALNDARQTPLLLGNIPRSKQHIKAIRKGCAVQRGLGIDVLSMNLKFERDWAGLTDLFSGKKIKNKLFVYPTTDRTAPSFIDLLRVVRDIKTRDERGQGASYVHCRAGKGRSATAVVAYVLCILHEGGFKVTVDVAERYVKQCRSQVRMNSEQKACLEQFQAALEQAGTLDQLCAVHHAQIAERDKAVELL